jgi:hypothetical protein
MLCFGTRTGAAGWMAAAVAVEATGVIGMVLFLSGHHIERAVGAVKAAGPECLVVHW